MTDKYIALTVVLEKPIRSDDAEAVINAIRMIKGVSEVTPKVADIDSYFAVSTARRELSEKLWSVLFPNDTNP